MRSDFVATMDSSSTSSSAGSGDRIMHMDLEHNARMEQERKPRFFVRAWKVPVSVLKETSASTMIRSVACLMTVM